MGIPSELFESVGGIHEQLNTVMTWASREGDEMGAVPLPARGGRCYIVFVIFSFVLQVI